MKRYLYSLILIFSSISLVAQEADPVIMKINGKDVKKSEFEYVYNKNNNEDAIDKRTVKEYVDLYKNFKLKVAEAEAQGMDTTAAFKTEMTNYRSQLAGPYLDDMEIDEGLIKKEYNRMGELLEVSHILIAFPDALTDPTATQIIPSDTVEVFKKANQIRNRLLKGEDFDKLAVEYSDDKRTKEQVRPGYLGWIAGMSLAPALEDAAFSTTVGGISPLAKTNYGYHIMKVTGKRANPGQVNAAHILIRCPEDADVVLQDDALKKANEIYDALIKGGDFAELAQENSEDPGSAQRGGNLNWFGYGAMLPEFQDAAFNIKEVGDISKPVKTQFGYHIIKLLGKKPLESYSEKKQDIETRLKNAGFTVALNKPGIDKMKQEHSFSKNDATYKKLLTAAQTNHPRKEEFQNTFEKNNDVLFTIDGDSYSVADFIGFLKNNNSFSSHGLSTAFLNDKLQSFEYNSLLQVKNNSLENNYPEFKYLMQEYRDGTLMFEISNKEVWEKAATDTIGLEKYFEANRSQFTWDEPRYKGFIIFAKDSKIKKKMQKETSKMNPEDAVKYLLDNYKVGDVSYVKVEKGAFKKGENPFVDEAAFKLGKAELPADFQDFFLIGKILPAPDSYTDVRGMAITGYQDYLEEQWIKKLNEKYPVVVYPEVLITVK